jgi:hypothetical protein
VPEEFANNVTVAVGGTANTIIVTGTRPETDIPPITGSFDVSVSRNGFSRTFAVNVNLTTTFEPPGTEESEEMEAILEQLEILNELQNGFYHWSLALAAMNTGLLVTTIIALIWGKK